MTTLGDGKRRVYQLLDEYTSGGTVTLDADIEKKMIDFFDVAQKDVAQEKKIYRTVTLQLTGGEGTVLYDLPDDLWQIVGIWKNGRITKGYPVIAGKLAAAGDDKNTLVIEYAATPATIPQDAKDSYEFEVEEDAAACMPYYVAAMVLLPDLVLDYSPYWQIYLTKRASLTPSVRESGGGGGVRQTLFRR